jgi:Holliday junction resolvase YEN1
MGVPAIWDAIKPGCGRRVPFPELVADFYEDNGRPIRIAIDAYQWVFECRGGTSFQNSQQSSAEIGKFIQNFFSKVRYLLIYNVSFVLVFDGTLKPVFKRNKDFQKDANSFIERLDFDKDNEEFIRIITRGEYKESDAPDVKLLKKILKVWNISYVESPADGESEAARLQKLNVVDFVMSNDSDVLCLGAQRVLKNFSKFREDRPAATSNNVSTQQTPDIWCTPVIMREVESKTGFNQKRLMLFSILCGADYNSGVLSLGPVRSSQIALSGSSHIKTHIPTYDYDDLPDFSEELYKIYSSSLNTTVRKARLESLKKDMLQCLKENDIVYFKRRTQVSLDGFPPDYVIMIYHNPLVSPELFKFDSLDTNFAEYNGQDLFKGVNLEELFKLLADALPSTGNIKDIGGWFSLKITEAYVLKSIFTNSDVFQVKLEKICDKNKNDESDDSTSTSPWTREYFSTRYQVTLDFKSPKSVWDYDDTPSSPRKKKGELLWVPKALIPVESQAYKDFLVMEKENKQKLKISPKKPLQANNLLSYLPLSPHKKNASAITKPKIASRQTSKSSSTQNKTSPVKKLDIFQSLKNSPRKNLQPVSLKVDQYEVINSSSDDESSPLKSPSKVVSPDPFESSPIIPKKDMFANHKTSEDDFNDSDDDMKDISSSRRKLDFSNIEVDEPTPKTNRLSSVDILDDSLLDSDSQSDVSLGDAHIFKQTPKQISPDKFTGNIKAYGARNNSTIPPNQVNAESMVKFRNILERKKTLLKHPSSVSKDNSSSSKSIVTGLDSSPSNPKFTSSPHKEILEGVFDVEFSSDDEIGGFSKFDKAPRMLPLFEGKIESATNAEGGSRPLPTKYVPANNSIDDSDLEIVNENKVSQGDSIDVIELDESGTTLLDDSLDEILTARRHI